MPRVRVTGQVRAERSTGADAVEVVRRYKDAVVQRDFDDLEHCVALNAAKALTKGRFSGVISGISPCEAEIRSSGDPPGHLTKTYSSR